MRRALAAPLFVLLACASDKGGPGPSDALESPPPKSPRRPAVTIETPTEPGLAFSLEAADPEAPARDAVARAKTTPLDDAEAARLLARLEPLEADPDDVTAFRLRKASKPAPKTGEVIEAPFPPPAPSTAAPTTAAAPLKVLRVQPEGEVHTVPRVTVTFDQPMVPISGVEDVDALPRPVKLEPEPPGQWRWLGSQTLVFEPKQRMPMGTTYAVTVDAGVTSALGGALAEREVRSFSTPGPSVRSWWPSGRQVETRPTLGVVFDQPVDPQAVLQKLRVRAGRADVKVRVATEAEIAADPRAKAAAKSELDRPRTVFLALDEDLPTDTKVVMEVTSGMAGLEGPRLSVHGGRHDFSTYPPLKLEEMTCGWGRECRPLMPWRVRFNNTLDPDRFTPDMVKVEPAVKGLSAEVSGSGISLRGLTEGRTTYEVTFSADITDRFGQRLGRPQTKTVKVGDAEPNFMITGGAMAVLDPAGKRSLAVHLVNYDELDVKIWKVAPGDWPDYLEWHSNQRNKTAPGKLVFDKRVKTGAPKDALHEYHVDLSAALEDGLGHAVVDISPPTGLLTGWLRKNPPHLRQWLQSTQLAVDAFVDHETALTWVTALADGQPKAGVDVHLEPAGVHGTSEADGLAALALPSSNGHDARIEVREGKDVAFLPESEWLRRNTSWHRRELHDQVRWFTFDDRGLYKPKEKVRVKGWLRKISAGPQGDVLGAPAGSPAVRYTVYGPRGNEVAKGSAKVGRFGGFDVDFDLPDDVNLGWAHVRFEGRADGVGGISHAHRFQIQEFRRPEFEVSAVVSEGPHLVGDAPVFTTEARYFAGGGLPAAPVRWQIASTPGHYQPPGQDRFTFGFQRPWWWWPSGGDDNGRSTQQVFAGETDATGAHRVRVPLFGVKPARPYVLKADATVTDVNRQVFSAHAQTLVHPSRLYVGLAPRDTFVGKGEPVIVEHVVTDLEGKLSSGRDVSLVAERLVYKRVGTAYQQVPDVRLECTATSEAAPGECRFEPEQPGQYRIRATVKDAEGRENQTEVTVWVGGSEAPPKRTVEEEPVRLVPDKDEYAVGDVAKVLVLAPFEGAEGLLSLRREGLLSTERFTIEGASHVLEIPITEGHLPKLRVEVHLAGKAPRSDDIGDTQSSLPMRPAHAAGSISLPVPATTRALTVSATPAQADLPPGAKTSVAVHVRDAAGAPVDAEVAVIVVDEAVLALSDYKLADPMVLFYAARSEGVQDHRLRHQVVLGRPDDLAQLAEAEGDGMMLGAAASEAQLDSFGGGGMPPPAPAGAPMMKSRAAPRRRGGAAEPPAPQPAIAVRKDFSALALFAPTVLTGADGRAEVQVDLPDNLTRYRVMAVAVDGARRFGKGESQITARLPLMVRPSAPRFLSFGDRFELPVVLQNQTGAAMHVQVALRSTNLGLTGQEAFVAEVPAHDRVEVRFEAQAEKPGTARFQVGAAAMDAADAATGTLPVYTPATTEAFATYGTVGGADDAAVRQPVARPKDAVTAFGGLEVSYASTQLQALTDAFIYLLEYPYGCSEQVASRVLSIAALRDVLAAFEAPGLPEAPALVASVGRDLDKLARLQNHDGGWGFWRIGHPSWPYVSVHVMHGLARADAAGFEVPQDTLRRGMIYLQRILHHFPRDYSPQVRRAIEAYALYVRALRGELDGARAEALLAEAGGVAEAPLEVIGWLYPVFVDSPEGRKVLPQIRRHLNNRAVEEAGTAHFVTDYEEGAHLLLHSSRRADGLLLEGLLRDQPDNDLVPKIVRGLLAHKKQGRWGNTQENAFVLLALERYFKTYEKVEPDFVARAWLGDGFAGEHTFSGRTTETHLVRVPMLDVPTRPEDLVIAKDGPGRLYYRIGMRYAPEDLELPPLERGFSVVRAYEAVDDPEDVRREADGTWVVKAGARVRVTLKMVAPTRRYHVALVDKLPAGFEPLNPALKGTEPIPEAEQSKPAFARYWWWYRPWYEHENLRDERVEAFSSLVWAGVHEYSYVARASTPGTFVAPPAKAEEMYAPEVFGRSGTAKVVVK